jgi:tRNA (cmo5U34)-methyltransferase
VDGAAAHTKDPLAVPRAEEMAGRGLALCVPHMARKVTKSSRSLRWHLDMSHSVRRHLRLEIDDYDATIRRFIPGYEEMLSVAAGAVASVTPERVVDLGAGTGGLSEAILGRREVGVVELLDVDPEMMEHARSRLGRFGDRVVFTIRSYDEPFRAGDAFAASLSLHHIPSLDRKAVLFARVYDALPSGGVFVNADANMPESLEAREPLVRVWAEHQVRQGIAEDQAWAHFDEWAEEDTYLPLESELAALRRIGFEADQVWSVGPIGVVVARKPPA